MPLARALATNQSACAQYYISVPPPASDKTEMRTGAASQIRALGANFHALAEVNVAGWQSWVASTGNSWYEAGVEARTEMEAAGFDVEAGDTWAINEFSSAVRQGSGTSREDMEQLVEGLDAGDGSTPRAQGVVFVEGIGQSTSPLDVYKANLESWLQDSAFWSVMSADVSDFLQETYGDIRAYAVAGADVPTRLSYLDPYLEHMLQLASVSPATAATALSFLTATYAPLANAAWAYNSGFGYTNVPYSQMEDYIAAQTDAMGTYDASIGRSTDRIGFAWDPSRSSTPPAGDFSPQTAEIIAQLVASIAASDDPDDPGAGACTPPWCSAVVEGAAFATAWTTFTTWAPTSVAFASLPLNVAADTASGPLGIQPEIGGVVTALPVDTSVVVSSSSRGGSFAPSADGPWTPTLDLTLPAGTTRATFYMLDSESGVAAVTATVDGQGASQVETVTGAPPTIALVSPDQGRAGAEVSVTGAGFTGATAAAVNGVAARFTVASDSEIKITVPAGATTGPISLTTASGSVTDATRYTVLGPSGAPIEGSAGVPTASR